MTNKFNKVFFILLLHIGVVHIAYAQCVEEQTTQNATGYSAAGQSFIPDCSGNIVSISMVTHPATVSGGTARLDIKDANCDTIWTVPQVTLTSGEEVTFDIALGSGTSRFVNLNDTYSFHLSNTSETAIFRANSVSPYADGCRMSAACSCISSADFMFSVEIEDAPLPIELTNFSLVTQDKSIHLSWQTASEQNTQNYTLERSANGGRTFDVIGSVAARNNPSGAEYEFIDETAVGLNAPQLYYMLRSQDFDGSSQRFGPVTANISLVTASELRVYPNPVSADRVIRVQGAAAGAKLELMVVDGRLLTTLSSNGESTYALPDLPAGVYMIRGQNEQGLSLSARFVVR